jgi:hypothetical protein
MAVSAWRIYYSDGSTFSDAEGSPETAPPFGVVCIVQRDPDRGRSIMHGWNWYYFNDAEGRAPLWWGCDTLGLHDRLLHRMPMRAVCLGRTVANDEFQRLMAAADADPDFVGYLNGPR